MELRNLRSFVLVAETSSFSVAAINILRFGLNHISAGTVDYTGGEEVRANLLKGRSSAKPEAHESLAHW